MRHKVPRGHDVGCARNAQCWTSQVVGFQVQKYGAGIRREFVGQGLGRCKFVGDKVSLMFPFLCNMWHMASFTLEATGSWSMCVLMRRTEWEAMLTDAVHCRPVWSRPTPVTTTEFGGKGLSLNAQCVTSPCLFFPPHVPS